MLEKETAGQDEDHFITVDAVGCFEGDEEEEEDDDDEEEEIEVEEEFCKQVLGAGWGGGGRLETRLPDQAGPHPPPQRPGAQCWHCRH